MKRVITRNGFVSDRFADADPVPIADYRGQGALLMSVEDDPKALRSFFDTLVFVVIPFDGSADGRGFSLAGALRAFGYHGHLRAQGHILVDQFRAALRCGFNDIAISEEQMRRNPEAQWLSVPFATSYRDHITQEQAGP